MIDYKLISADSHVGEPLELWQERLPEKFRPLAPHRETRDGKELLIQHGMRPKRVGMGTGEMTEEDLTREQAAKDGWDPDYRIKAQDQDGVAAEVIYPNYGLELTVSPDAEFQLASARAYNDWAMEIFGPRRDRFTLAALIPVLDIEGAIEEIYRVAKMGLGSLFVPSRPTLPYNRPEYEPLWSAAEEVGLPVNFHASSGRDPRIERGPGGAVINFIMGFLVDGMDVLAYICPSGVLMRHPNMKIVIVEAGIGWLAWDLQAMDEGYEKHHMYARPKLDMNPSEYFKRQGYATFGEDVVGLHNRQYTGVDCLLWGNDYPHHEGTWPHSREAIERQFAGVSEEDKKKIISTNAAKLYGFNIN
ncbi:MAG: amidohydrolase [Chloroflexi bacterium]|nr:amidohydrolase [Chloroflexota bacterium]